MLKKILIGFICIGALLLAARMLLRHGMGMDAETIFEAGGCARNDEMGVTYRVDGGPMKGSIGAQVILSDKYPSSDLYKVGSRIRLSLEENPQKLYSVKCP